MEIQIGFETDFIFKHSVYSFSKKCYIKKLVHLKNNKPNIGIKNKILSKFYFNTQFILFCKKWYIKKLVHLKNNKLNIEIKNKVLNRFYFNT